MNRVIPIDDEQKLKEIKEELKKKGTMPLLLWTFGINTSLRISDILPIQVKDVLGDKLYLKEQKTGKRQEIILNKGITDILEGYIKNMQQIITAYFNIIRNIFKLFITKKILLIYKIYK